MKNTQPSFAMRCFASLYGRIRTAGPTSLVAYKGGVLMQHARQEPVIYTPLEARALANYLYELADHAEGHAYRERSIFGATPSVN